MISEFSKTLDYINNMNCGVVSIIGTGKTFKSGTLYSLLQEGYCPNLAVRPKAFYRFPDVDFPNDLRSYFVEDFDDVESGSILIIEDANRVFPSRSSRSPELQEYLGISSHKDVLIFITVQSTANTDQCFFRDQDSVLLFKHVCISNIAFERPEIAQFCNVANVKINKASKVAEVNPLYVTYCPRFDDTFILDNPPSWYGREHSHALANYKIHPKKAVS